MMEDQIVPDENENISTQEDQDIFAQDNQNNEIFAITSEEVDLGTPFFQGFGLAGAMCLMSLGIAVIIQIFRKA